VDVYVAGCPPRPEALIHGIMMLHEKVRHDRINQYRSTGGDTTALRIDGQGREVAVAERR
jgi:NADH-quinone oxidoreductase subunit B